MELAGILFIAGAATALASLISPFTGNLYGRLSRPGNEKERMAYIEAHRFWWHQHNLGFAAGAAVVAAGFLLNANDVLTWGAAIAAAMGAALGVVFAIQRSTVKDLDAWYSGDRGTYTFGGFTLLTLAGFLLLAIAVLDTTLWLAIFLFGWEAILITVLVRLQDLPPFTHYIGALVVGIAMLA